MKNEIRLLTLFLLVLGAASCSKKSDQVPLANAASTSNALTNEVILTDEQVKATKVELGYLEKRQMSNTVKASGILDVPPQNLVTISAPLGGFVKHTELLQGMKVRKGQ